MDFRALFSISYSPPTYTSSLQLFSSSIQKSLKILIFTFSTDRDKFDAFAGDEVQSLVDIGDFVEPHLATVGLLQGFSGNDLQEEHKFEAIAEILFDVLDLSSGLAQMWVHPCCEGLKWCNNMWFSTLCLTTHYLLALCCCRFWHWLCRSLMRNIMNAWLIWQFFFASIESRLASWI